MTAFGLEKEELQAVLDLAPVGIAMMDPAGRFLHVNRAFQQMTGYSLEQLREMSYSNISHPDDAMLDLVAQRDLLDGQTNWLRVERRVTHRSGRVIWCWADVSAVRDRRRAVRHVIMMLQNITEQKQAQEQLRRSEERYRLHFETGHDVLFIVDRDMRIASVSRSVADVLGYQPEELVGKTVAESGILASEQHVQQARGDMAVILSGGRMDMTPYQGWTKSGELKHVEVTGSPLVEDGKVTGAVIVVRDVSQRKAVEDALARSENMLSNIIEQSPFSTWIADAAGTDIRQNAACRRLFGIDRDEQTVGVYSLFRDRLVAEQGHVEAIRKVFSEGKTARFVIDYDLSKAGCVSVPNSVRRLLDVTIFPIKDESGKVIYAVAQQEDITELHEKEQQLLQAQKMEAIGNLVGSIAHDFNNQLTVVKGYCDLLLGGLASDEGCYEPVEQIRKAAQRAAALTGQLLAYSRKQVLRPQAVDVNRLVLEMADPIKKIIGDKIVLKTALAADPAMVRADLAQMQQAITNVILNARDAMPDGGTLTMATWNLEDTPPSVAAPGESWPCPCVVLAITDTGSGMDDETRSHIFDPFFTTKPLGRGTGLGLSMVYGFVKQSGGRVEVASRLGEGSTFRLYFPQVSPQPVSP